MSPYRTIEQALGCASSLSGEMAAALRLWYDLYTDQPPWREPGKLRTLNLPAMIAGEIARQVTLELGWRLTGPDGGDNPRAAYLRRQFARLADELRGKLEQGCAAGGMIVKPWPCLADGNLYFDFAMDWSFTPLAFDEAGGLRDVVIPDVIRQGRALYTRLERHRLVPEGVEITQRAFKSTGDGALGSEVALDVVPAWAALSPRAVVTDTGGPLFGWYRVAQANSVDPASPMGASVYSRAVDVIRQIDSQYSRLLWEYEGGELAIDVDPTALYPRRDGRGGELPRLNERLFRAVDTGMEETYRVFAPQLRDESLINGLNQLMMRAEDLCGLSRGTLCEANLEARTATELKLMRQRSYATVADNQRALEKCLREVVRAMDRYATAYALAPEGGYELSFDWDDSVITDTAEQLRQRLLLVQAGALSREELRQWYLGESEEQAHRAIERMGRAGA